MLRTLSKAWLAGAVICVLVSPEAHASIRHKRTHIHRSGPEFHANEARRAERTRRIATGIPNADSYQAPDGTYYSLADTVRSVEGTPCGIECETRHE